MLDFQLDMTQFYQKVARSKHALDLDAEAATVAAAKHGRERAQEGKFKDSGRSDGLRATMSIKPIGWRGATFWASFQTNKPYALWVEEDTKPHIIEPISAAVRGTGPGPHEYVVGRGIALRWKDAGGGEHFARIVHHPGTTGFHFMKHAEGWAHSFLVKQLSYRLPNLIGVWMQ